MTDKFFQDRDNAGKTISGKLMSKVEDSANDYRTVVISDGGTTTMLKTKGGMPEVTQTKPVSACVLFPLVEKTLAGALTQADRLYHHDHEVDAAVEERRKFSSDGLLSLIVKPLRRLRLYSEGLAKYITVWFADYSRTPTAVDTSKPEYTAAVTGIKATESLLRTYYTPVFIPYNHDAGANSDLKKLGFVFKRIKDMVFSTAEFGEFKVVFGNYSTATLPGSDVVGTEKLPKGASELLASRTFYGTDPWSMHKVKELFFTEGKLTVATPGGIMEPVRRLELDILDPQQQTFSTKVRPLTSMTDLVTFGKIWHGFLEQQNNGSGPRILWDSAEKTRQLLIHNTNPTNGPVVDIEIYTYGGYDRYYKFPDQSANTGGAVVPDGAAFNDYAILTNGRLGCLVDSPMLLPNHNASVSDILYKDSKGGVWKITFTTGGALGAYLIVTVTGRIDDFMETKTTCSVEIANFFVATTSSYYKLVVKNSPDSKKAAVLLYTGTPGPSMLLGGVDAYYLFEFSGDGSTETATYGQGISCTWSGAAGWETDGGPLGRIYTQEITNSPNMPGGAATPAYTLASWWTSESRTGTPPNETVTQVWEDLLKVNANAHHRSATIQKTMHDIVFKRDTGTWERVDFEDSVIVDRALVFSGFSTQTIVRTVVTGPGVNTTTYAPSGPLTGQRYDVVTTTRLFRMTPQAPEQALVGRQVVTNGQTFTFNNGTLAGPDAMAPIPTVTSGIPTTGVTPSVEAVGPTDVGYPYIGRYVSGVSGANTYSSSVCYENAVSDFLGESGIRIAYDPVNEKLVKLNSTTYASFI